MIKKKVSTYKYEFFADEKEADYIIDKEKEAYCLDCEAIVEFETRLTVTGLHNVCPFCSRHLDVD